MAQKRKPSPRRRAAPVEKQIDASQIVFGPRAIKWVLGALGTLLAVIIGWTQVWDRIEAHWRLETIQATRDKQIDAEIKNVREKAEADTKALAKRAEVGRSWLFYNLSDFRADNSQQWAQVCTALKQPPEVCAKWQADAAQLRQEAADAKRSATETGKGTP